jgi:hypothetical protein
VRRDKVILTDVDGVLLDWEYAFDRWMYRHGYTLVAPEEYLVSKKYDMEHKESRRLIKMFNESASIRKIPPLRDAMKYVKKLHEEHGYVFHVVTSQTDDEYAQTLRKKNLREIFGPSVFETFIILGTGDDKDEALAPYKDTNCWWIEDKPENAQVGYYAGLDALLMHQPHNAELSGMFKRVYNWKDVYERITG